MNSAPTQDSRAAARSAASDTATMETTNLNTLSLNAPRNWVQSSPSSVTSETQLTACATITVAGHNTNAARP